MNIVKTKNGNSLHVVLEGRLDTNTAPELESSLNTELEDVTELSFDFEKLDYISSAGLRVMLTLQKRMNRIKGKMTISHVCETIRDVFEMTGFADILTLL